MRLIDADAMILEINELPYRVHGKVINLIAKQPTIEERKKGEWEFPYTDKRYKKCSVCGREFYSIPHTAHYCPNCGSDMRGDGDD